MTIRDFRVLSAGAATSLPGDQFALIATAWLALRLTTPLPVLGQPRSGHHHVERHQAGLSSIHRQSHRG